MKKNKTFIIIILIPLFFMLNKGILKKIYYTNKINNIKNSIVKITARKNIIINNNWIKIQKNFLSNTSKWYWFFINNSWTIFTNYHIIKNSKNIIINYKNKDYKAKITDFSDKKDLAKLQININNKNFLKLNNDITKNIITIIDNKIINWKIIKKESNNIYKTNFKLKKWYSWTPVFNKNLDLIWINSMIDNKNFSYFIFLK